MRTILLMGVITLYATNSLAWPNRLIIGTKPVYFSDESFKAIAEDASGNVVYSPFSLTTILSMISWGAAGHTRAQLHSVLQYPYESVPQRDVESTFEDSSEGNEGVQLEQANKIFIAEGFTPKSGFTFTLSQFFKSETQSVNFNESADASKTINDWCANQTHNHIKELIQPDDLDSNTALVLANALYFKGTWSKLFDEDQTALLPFYVNETTVKKVPTMWKVDRFRYGELPEVKARFIELPYKTNKKTDPISMFIILPDEINGIKNLVKNFDKITMKKLHSGEMWDVKLLLPKFRIEMTIDLEPSLVKLGLKDLFQSSADFSDISEDRQLKISKIVQKTFIEVNEKGTEAASATASQLDSRFQQQEEVSFVVDRPFICIIANEFGVPIITAVTVDPSSKL